ncbi:MAG: PKD domain-containing protein [Deltaproteobacteria bacterium]|nr:PKD domain-containing protein [Deltaproteobacteria bacterium]
MRLGAAALLAACATEGGSVPDAGAPANSAPYARLKSPARAAAGAEAVFDGSDSNDPDGIIVEYRFLFGDGSSQVQQAGPSVAHAYAAEGEYGIIFAVKDDTGETAEVERKIEVVADMSPYVCTADAGCEPYVQECDNGVCYFVGGSSGCSSDSDCEGGYACTDGACRPSDSKK